MTKISIDKNLVAYCGLYCGACPQFVKAKCQGCQKNDKATWCQIRVCCAEKSFSSCAQCKDFSDVNNCKKFNNFFSKLFAFIFRSNRKACLERIKVVGLEKFAKEMAENKTCTIKR
jgi:hypothetical protein